MPQQNSGAATLRPEPPDPAVIAWLWSEEGIAWSHVHIMSVRHGGGLLAEVKNDHECEASDGSAPYCGVQLGYSPFPDDQIVVDLRRYGLSGVPVEWKERYRRYSST